MGRLFKEAFPNASIKSELLDIFSDVMVDRIVVNQRMHLVKLYLKYDRLIQKKYIFSLENELNRKLFAQHQLTVKIYEKYELSQQYSMEVLLENYFESLLLEVNEYDKLMYSVLKKSNPVMQGDEIVLRLADSLVARKKASEIEHVFDKVLGERFGYTVQLRIEYEEAKESKYKKENEQRARRKLSEIAISYGGSDDTEGGTNDTVLVTDESESLSEDNEKAKETLTVLEDVDPETGEILSKRSEYGASALKGGNTQAKAPAPQKANGFTKKEGKTYGKWDGKKNFKREGGWGDEKTLKKSDNPDVVYNSDFDGDALELAEVCDEIGEIIVQGTILTIDSRDLPKSEKKMIRYDISDFTDSMKIKLFLKPELGEELLGILKVGDFIKVKGVVKNDTFDRELIMTSVRGIKKIGDFRKKREDNATRKRVELHCHTKMSDMDAVSSVRDIVKQAKRYGHTAMAVTDHGDVQAFPDANHALEKGDNFKVIYGVEAYLVDDMKKVVTDGRGQSLNDQFVVFDLETTGVIATKHKIIEIGAVRVENGVITQRFSEFVNPKVPIPLEIEKLTGIDDSMVMEAPVIDEILPRFLEFCKDCVMVAHNADFDMGFIKHNANVLGLTCEATYIDTVGISRVLFPGQHKHTLDAVAKTMGVSLENHHRAVDDAEATAEIFVKFIPKLYEHQVYDLTQLNEFGTLSEEATRRLHYYHAIVLAKNEIGRRNLYKLVSMSNINYFQNRPKMPKSKIMEYREGLILGSACERGELYQAIADERSDAVIAGIVDFYDY
ncbi:MAG TPA: exonuclease domain-containing protein, partial [Lachnospiraceae bacterium]|nr:exonuclease domain-containing protein [Lachnospiraceae bacterium]